jgi:hypothetical protein
MDPVTLIMGILLLIIVGTITGVSIWYSTPTFVQTQTATVAAPVPINSVPVIVNTVAATPMVPTPTVPAVPTVPVLTPVAPIAPVIESKPVTITTPGAVVAPVVPISQFSGNFSEIIHTKDQLCLDASGNSVYIGKCNGGDFQKWNQSNGVVKHKQSGKCLDASIDKDGKSSVYINDCNATQYQAWTKTGDNLTHGQTKQCLDSDGKTVYLNPCETTNDFQKWSIKTNVVDSLVNALTPIGSIIQPKTV